MTQQLCNHDQHKTDCYLYDAACKWVQQSNNTGAMNMMLDLVMHASHGACLCILSLGTTADKMPNLPHQKCQTQQSAGTSQTDSWEFLHYITMYNDKNSLHFRQKTSTAGRRTWCAGCNTWRAVRMLSAVRWTTSKHLAATSRDGSIR